MEILKVFVCTAFTTDISATIKELELMSINEEEGKIVIAYTVWALKKGAGKKIMRELLRYMKEKNHLDSVMTLSPLTPMATHYHIRNGTKLIKINPTTGIQANTAIVLFSSLNLISSKVYTFLALFTSAIFKNIIDLYLILLSYSEIFKRYTIST